MPRRRTYSDSPGGHLAKAAAVHARITSGERHPSESEVANVAVDEASSHSRSAKAQRRNDEGKFA